MKKIYIIEIETNVSTIEARDMIRNALGQLFPLGENISVKNFRRVLAKQDSYQRLLREARS